LNVLTLNQFILMKFMQKSKTKSMYLTRKFTFDSAHKLKEYDGKCKKLHGHTYILEATISGEIDERSGMIIDFKILREIVEKEVIEKLDHQYLNDFIKNPTAENVIKWIWEKLIPRLRKNKKELVKLRLWETPDTSVTLYKISKNNL